MCHSIECGCGYPSYHVSGWTSHHHWGYCCSPGYGRRRFTTREEILAELEEYLKELRAEAKGVEEQLERLRKGEH